jgi:hypothetical protein
LLGDSDCRGNRHAVLGGVPPILHLRLKPGVDLEDQSPAHLNPGQRSAIVLVLKPILAAAAKERMAAGGRNSAAVKLGRMKSSAAEAVAGATSLNDAYRQVRSKPVQNHL